MSDVRVASRYAKSLLELAQEKGQLEQVKDDMDLFAKTVFQNRDLYLALRNPIINHDKKLNILRSLFADKVQEMTMAIFTLITKKNREAILPYIAQEFVNQYNLVHGIQKAQVTTATPITPALRQELMSLVSKQTGGMTVQLEEKVDPALLGGFLLRVGDRQIDDSLRSSLRKLRKTFSENPYIPQI